MFSTASWLEILSIVTRLSKWSVLLENKCVTLKYFYLVLPGGPLANILGLPVQGVQVKSLVRELDPTCCNSKKKKKIPHSETKT